MDSILQVLMSWQFVLFSLSVVAVTTVFRTIVEYLLSNVKIIVKESKLWNDLILPILPVVIGPVGAILVNGYPYPDGILTSDARFVFGLVAGLLSGLMYRVIKAILNQKISAVLPLSTVSSPIVDPGIDPNSVPTLSSDPGVDALIKKVSETITRQ